MCIFHAIFLINPDFNHFNNTGKLISFILSNVKMIFKTAKACHYILQLKFNITFVKYVTFYAYLPSNIFTIRYLNVIFLRGYIYNRVTM